jgi:hypothetical protein
MTAQEVIAQLLELKLHCESMTERNDNWERDIFALEYAIDAIEKDEYYKNHGGRIGEAFSDMLAAKLETAALKELGNRARRQE